MKIVSQNKERKRQRTLMLSTNYFDIYCERSSYVVCLKANMTIILGHATLHQKAKKDV